LRRNGFKLADIAKIPTRPGLALFLAATLAAEAIIHNVYPFMSSPLLLPGSVQASRFLHTLPATARQRGERYWRAGRVASLEQTSPHSFTVKVRGSDVYSVVLNFYPEDGWSASCTCPMMNDCKHVYAAMKALLAADSEARVQKLSAGAPSNEPKPEGSIAKALAAAVGRELDAEEQRYVAKVAQTYRQCRSSRRLYWVHVNELGLSIQRDEGGDIQIWPSFPETEVLFWNYLAFAHVQSGGRVPALMKPVTDLESVREPLARWQQTQSVERWKAALGNAVRFGHLRGRNAVPRCELRAHFGDDAIALQWRRSGMPVFETMKPMQVRQLRDDIVDGSVQLAPEAVWFWEIFGERLESIGRTNIEYTDQHGVAPFHSLFRLPAFAALIVNPDFLPFERATEPLQWRLQNPENDGGDYIIRLARADNSPMPPLLVELAGEPTLYVTRTTVFEGPSDSPGLIESDRDNRIPSQALETPAGAALLVALNLEMPPRLRERVRTVPLHVRLTCRLDETWPGGSSETCIIEAMACGTGGAALQGWTGYGWSEEAAETDGAPKPKRVSRLESFTIYDRTALHDPRQLLSSLDARWEGYMGRWSRRVTKKFPAEFVQWLQMLPPDVELELKGELASLREQAVAGRVKLEVVEAEIDWFDLRVVLDVADTTLSKDELKLLLNARGGYVRLKDKGWRRLEFNLSEEENEQLARLGLSTRELTGESQRLHALQLADTAAKRFIPDEQFERISRRAVEIKTRVTPPIPESIRAELRPYQQEGFHFLAYLAENRFGGILADDMGLGKTLQTLTWLEWLRQTAKPQKDGGRIPPSVVVCPKSVADNWRAEAERFAPALRVKIWTAGELPTFQKASQEFGLHVLNYNQLRLAGESLKSVQWHAVILDEGQYIKNPASVTAQIARSLSAQHRLILSGTPIENRLLDLWSLMSFAMPGVLGSRSQFAKLYDSKEDPLARRRLSARVRPFLLRRTKSQVARDLPDRVEEDLYCEMEGEQKTLYRAELKRAQQMLLLVQTQKQLAKERFNFLTSLLRLRQICCHPKLVKADSKAGSAKVEALLEQLEPLMEEGHKVLIFSQFVEMLNILRGEIEPRGWPIFFLAGNTENRGELVQQFQSAEGAAVFLISLKAGGFGLNLTAASYVVLFDPWWNPAVEHQAIDRTHRIGQTRNVMAYRLLIKSTIEEKIRTLQKKKSALADDVLGEEKFAQALTLDDLHFLFSDTET
jgi:SNF2-related domain/Helicase conserved C-terminal domain